MKSLKEQLLGRCIHFNGLMNKSCDVGLVYMDVKDRDARPYLFPCLKQGGICLKAQFMTEDEAEKEANLLEDKGIQSMNARHLILAEIKATGKRNGTIQCPVCNGELHFNKAETNGHIWANCQCGFGWME